jgi:hypothetical protein
MDPRQPPTTDEPPPQKPQSWTNAIASFMRRHHIHASRGEWFHIHRNHRFGNGPGGWWPIVVVIGLVWLAYQIFLWLVGILRAIIQGVAEFLTTIAPILMLIIIAGVVAAFKRRRR